MRPRRRDLVPGAGTVLCICLAFSAVAGRAEPLLTNVSVVDGVATYALFVAGGGDGAGLYTSPLHSGMTVPGSVRIDIAPDSRVMIHPIPAIRYLLQAKTRVINSAFGFHETATGGKAFDYRLNLLEGTLVGEVAGPLRDVDNRIDTPRAVVSASGGKFLVRVQADGSCKYAVLHGTVDVGVPGKKDYHVEENEVLTILADSVKRDLVNAARDQAGSGGPERQVIAQAGDVGSGITSLSDDPELLALLQEPFPAESGDKLAAAIAPPDYDLLPGQQSVGYNPANFPQGAVPPISPIFP